MNDPFAELSSANHTLNRLLEQQEAAMEGCGPGPLPWQIEAARAAVHGARWHLLISAYTRATSTTGEGLVAELRAALPDASDDEILSALSAGNELASANLAVAGGAA